MDETKPLTPAWWLRRLWKALNDADGQRDVAEQFDDYYTGNHPLPWLTEDARDEFRRILRMSRSNYCGLVVDAVAEIARIEGFRVKGNKDAADKALAEAMDDNEFDLFGDLAILESLVAGTSFLMVAPRPTGEGMKSPLITVETATQAISEDYPGRPLMPAAQLKTWDDDWTGAVMANLFIGGEVYKFSAARPTTADGARPRGWVPDWRPLEAATEPWPARNPLGRPPMFPLPCNPRADGVGVSELWDVIDTQDRINKTIADRLMTQDFGAFPQMNATAYPLEDEDGNPTPPIDIGRNRLVVSDKAETTFGQWSAAPLDPYSSAKREDVKDIAARTRTPADYLLGELTNVNGQTLIASRAGLVAKTRERMRGWDLGVERMARAVRKMMGAGDEPVETIWSNPEFRTEAEKTDATLKKLQTRIIDIRQAREDLGYTVKQIEALERRDAEAEANDPALRAARMLNPGGVNDPGRGDGSLPPGAGAPGGNAGARQGDVGADPANG